MTSPFAIRRARPDEAEALSAIARAAKQSWGYPDALIAEWAASLDISPGEVAAKPTFAAVAGGSLVGFYLLAPAGGLWSLEHLWVAPAEQRRGAGRALLVHAVETARAGGASRLAIDADPNAEPFYLACGAERVGAVAAPIAGDPLRARPQLVLTILR